MNKVIKTSIISLIILIFISFASVSYAASFSVSSSATSVTKGKTFTITINGSSVTGRFNLSSSSNISLSQTSIWVENNKASITATANSAGSGSITVTAANVADAEGNDVTGSKSISVTITEPSSSSSGESSSSSKKNNNSSKTNTSTKTNNTNTNEKKEETKKSSDAKLSSLKVQEGEITPAFSKDIKEYALTVPNEITKVNVLATTNDSRGIYSVSGNEELQEGKNIVTVTVKAEDGTKENYVINVTRLRQELSLASLVIRYKDQEGNMQIATLTPEFNFEIYEYTLEDIEYWVENLEIEATANLENATIDISGQNNLLQGENTVTIIAKIIDSKEEGKEPEEEIKTYTIKFNKNEEPIPPTLMKKISNWFKGIFGGITNWYNNNQQGVVLGALALCVTALFGLSIYIIVDYKKYEKLVEKLKIVNDINSEQIETEIKTISEEVDISQENLKEKKGRHF